jgi:hypothetical protein
MDSVEKTSRKNFVARGLGLAALLMAAALPFVHRNRSKKKGKTVKMLTEDGQLVEVDESLLPSGRKKITNGELKGWVKKSKSDNRRPPASV